MIGLKSRNHISAIQENLAKAEFSMGYNIHEHIKDILLTFDNSLLFTESIQNTTQIFPLNHNVRFLPCQHQALA